MDLFPLNRPEADTSLPVASATGVIDTRIASPEGDTTNAGVPPSGLWTSLFSGPVANATGNDLPPSGLGTTKRRDYPTHDSTPSLTSNQTSQHPRVANVDAHANEAFAFSDSLQSVRGDRSDFSGDRIDAPFSIGVQSVA